uniref:Uncharacterized protein n=1 Tax=Oryza punctata TaxID=4537 RepID=A0A0E0K9E3_ORYPU
MSPLPLSSLNCFLYVDMCERRGKGGEDDQANAYTVGEWDGLVSGEEYSSQIRDQAIRQNRPVELVPPGTSAQRESRRFAPRCVRRPQERQQLAAMDPATPPSGAATVGSGDGDGGGLGDGGSGGGEGSGGSGGGGSLA